MPKALESPWVTSALKAGPLSLWRLLGRQESSMARTRTTSLGCLVLQGKVSIHPENVFTNISSDFDLGPPFRCKKL
jgi:hypothetical protein